MYFDMNKTTPEEVADAIFAAKEAAAEEESSYVPYEEMEPGTKMPDRTYYIGMMDGNTTNEDIMTMAELAAECQKKWFEDYDVEVDEDGEPLDPDWEAKLRERDPDVVIF